MSVQPAPDTFFAHSGMMFTNGTDGYRSDGSQGQVTRYTMTVTFSTALNVVEIEYVTDPMFGPAPDYSVSCPTLGAMEAYDSAGTMLTLPATPNAGCYGIVTVTSTLGITKLVLHPTPDSDRLQVPNDPYPPAWETMRTSYNLAWDAPPAPQKPRCAPAADSVLNDELLRDSLWSAWQRTFADSAREARRERGGMLLRSSSTGARRAINPQERLSTPCRREAPSPFEADEEVLITYHTHPFKPGDRVAADTTCGWKNTMAAPPFSSSDEYFSSSDFANAKVLDSMNVARGFMNEAQMVVMNKDNVYRIGVRASSAGHKSRTIVTRWRQNACRFFASQI